jgi:hypothetical protein
MHVNTCARCARVVSAWFNGRQHAVHRVKRIRSVGPPGERVMRSLAAMGGSAVRGWGIVAWRAAVGAAFFLRQVGRQGYDRASGCDDDRLLRGHETHRFGLTVSLSMNVFVLSYLRPLPDGPWAGMFIGVYSSLEKVEAAQQQMQLRPGYRDFPGGFRIDCYRIDEDYDDPMFFTAWGPGEQPGEHRAAPGTD